jgi:DNA-binding NarL/FixJ family response regulator
MLRILLIDDHSIITTGLQILISRAYPQSKIDIANDGKVLYEFIKKDKYDLVFLDFNIPGEDSSSILSHILTFNPETKVIIFSMNNEDQYAKRMYNLGAKGYLNKSANDAEILRAIEIVLSNKTYLSENFILKLTDDLIYKRSDNLFDKLSKREFEVMLLLIKGLPSFKIAETLNLHTSTIGTFKSKIFEKIGVDNIISLRETAELNGIEI